MDRFECPKCGQPVVLGNNFCTACGFDPGKPASADGMLGEARVLPFTFTGSAREYFGIWAVNIALSIVTLGIYSAWAKVRRVRYFYGNTWLDGHNFEYHAKPKQILIGRLLVVALLIAYQVLIHISPIFLLLGLVYVLALPWVINKAIAFNAGMTSYRNVRLSFRGSYGQAFIVYILHPFLMMITLGLTAPFYSRAASEYVGTRLSYGTSGFRTWMRAAPLYGSLGLGVLVGLAWGLVVAGAAFGLLAISSPPEGMGEFSIWHWLLVLAPYPALILGLIVYRTGVRNAAFSATWIEGGHRFGSDLGRLAMTWVVVSNFAVTIATLGLMRP